MTVAEAIAAAPAVLPGVAAPDGAQDPRWQAIIAIGDFIESDPEPIWDFVAQWGTSPDPDLRDAVATCLLEHLLEYHFDRIFPRVEASALRDPVFADTFKRCWRFRQAKTSAHAARFDALAERLRTRASRSGSVRRPGRRGR